MINKLIVAVLLAGSATGVQAANLLTNGSFETPNIGNTNYFYPGGSFAGWDWVGSALVNAQSSSAWYGGAAPAGQDGTQFAALQGQGTLSQSFVATGGRQVISWLAGGRPFFGNSNGDQSYSVSLGGPALGTFSTVSGQAFGANSLIATGLTAGNSYTLTFTGLVARDETSFIDGVSVSAVPEPAMWGLMIAGFGLVGVSARRRNRAAVAA